MTTQVEVVGQVGPQVLADGAIAAMRQGKSAELVIQQLHGRYYEQNYRGAVFSGGMNLTSISNATFSTGTLGVTCTPVAGVYNPATSPVNVVILQAMLSVIITALQATGCGGFLWAASVGNTAVSTGNVPLNRKSLAKSGSFAKDMTNVALTGLTNNLVVMGASALNGGANSNLSTLQTAAGLFPSPSVSIEYLDGSWIVPPGGVLALLTNGTAVAHSASSMLVWEETPL